MDILIGSTDQWVRVRAMTAASAALTGKLAADFAFWYARQGEAPVAITPLVDKSPGDAHADGGVYEEGRGWYWVGVPDAAFATGVPSVGISGTVSGGIVLDAPIRLSTHNAADVAALILETPANKLVTDGDGYVTFNNTSIGTVATLTNAPPDSAGVGTLLTRVPQVISMAQIGGAGAYYVEVLDATGAAVAPAATALSTATWTATKAGYLDAAISTRQATVTNLANVVTMAAQFSTMIVLDGAVYDFTAAALAAAPSGSGLSAQEVRDAMKLAPTAGDPDAGSVDKHLDDLLEDTGTTLPTQIAALDISAGTGTYACTWTVDDGSTALEGAKVSFWLAGVLRGTGTTDASGEVSMSLDAGTYTVAISLSGYTFASTTHTVSAMASTWTKTFSMTAIVFSPTPDADQVTAWGYVYGPAGTVESGATIVLEQRTAGARQIYDNAPRTLTADGSGLVSAVVWADGSEYRYRRGTGGEWSELFAPEDDEDPDLPNSYRLPGWLGAS